MRLPCAHSSVSSTRTRHASLWRCSLNPQTPPTPASALKRPKKKKKKHPAQRPTLGQKTPFSHPAVETTYTPTQHACQGHPCTGVCWRESKRERSFILLKRGTRAGGVRRDAEMPRYVQNTATLLVVALHSFSFFYPCPSLSLFLFFGCGVCTIISTPPRAWCEARGCQARACKTKQTPYALAPKARRPPPTSRSCTSLSAREFLAAWRSCVVAPCTKSAKPAKMGKGPELLPWVCLCAL